MVIFHSYVSLPEGRPPKKLPDTPYKRGLELAVGFISQPKRLNHQLQNQVPPCFVQSC